MKWIADSVEQNTGQKDTLIFNAHLVDAEGEKTGTAILCSGGKIASLPTGEQLDELLADEGVAKFDAGGRVLMPSFVDLHAHFRDPGFSQKEDIASGCRAAVSGGYSTCVLMANTHPVISSQSAALANNCKAEKLGLCRVIQAVSITRGFDGATISHLEELEARVCPLISEDGHDVASPAVMLDAMKTAAKRGLVVACHCEDEALAKQAGESRKRALALLSWEDSPSRREEAAALLQQANSLLARAEDEATVRNLRLAREAGCRIHLCHVSTKASLDAALQAKRNGTRVSLEVTPHHLFLSTQDAANIFKIVNPPVRGECDRQALVGALLNGDADCIATDHAPHTHEDKREGSPGFSALECAFAASYTMLVRQNAMSLASLSALMSLNPARILHLGGVGLLKEGYEANLVVADTTQEWTVKGEEFYSKGKASAFEGMRLFGVVQATFFRGNLVFSRNGAH